MGKLDDGGIYGLRLYNTEGDPSFQSDSDGNLWLSKHIKVGGNYNKQTHQYDSAPNAGIVGLTTSTPTYQMGIIRNSDGTPYWESSTIRFWAGPQRKLDYLAQLGLTQSEIESISNWDNIQDNDPALARFKVDEHGNIIASGIDVGGWIGSGKILRSKNHEAILRSDGYTSITPNYPVLAIGQQNPLNIDETGRTNNFRVFQDGSVNIGRDVFTVSKDGAVVASNLTITGGSITLGGTEQSPVFQVTSDGTVIANNISIGGANSSINGGSIAGWSIENNKFYKLVNDIYLTALYANRDINSSNIPVLYIGEIDREEDHLEYATLSEENATKTKFKISSDGSVFFHGGIYGWSTTQNKFRKGLDYGQISLYTSSTQTISVEINQGLIVDISTNV